MRSDRQLQDDVNQDEQQEDIGSSEDSASHAKLAMNGENDRVQQFDVPMSPVIAHEKRRVKQNASYAQNIMPAEHQVIDLSRWVTNPVNEDCQLLLEWATEFKSCGNDARNYDDKRATASSKGCSSATTIASIRDS
jgi:hypothetical protein